MNAGIAGVFVSTCDGMLRQLGLITDTLPADKLAAPKKD
jgi:hypothetical protein